MKYAKQRDANEVIIVTALESLAGCVVQKLDGVGIPDLLVSYRGELFLLEVKNPNAKGGSKYNTGEGCLTAAQSKWWAKWAERGGKAPVIVRDVNDALVAIGARL